MLRRIAVPLAAVLLLSGCLDLFGREDARPGYEELGWEGIDVTGRSAGDWPDLDGVQLVVLDLTDWPQMPEAIDLFEDLTGADVVQELGTLEDPEDMVSEEPAQGVVFGLDQVQLGRLAALGAVEQYTPMLQDRLGNRSDLLEEPWTGVAFQHQYGAVQWYGNESRIRDLFDVRTHRADLILPDPLDDPFGRAFLLLTIGTYGEDPSFYNWKTYWRDLWSDDEGCVTIAPGYQEAYFDAFVGANATSTHSISFGATTDPAVLVNNGTIDAQAVPNFLTGARQSWHLVRYSAVVNNTSQLAAAQAWQEFLLTEAFQNLVEDAHALPVVDGHRSDAFEAHAPDPDALQPAFIPVETIGQRWSTWAAALEDIRPENGCL